MTFATVEGMVGDEPALATYPLDRRTTRTINVAGAGVFLDRDPAGRGVPIFVNSSAGDQVLDLVAEWNHVDGGHLLVSAVTSPRRELPWRRRLRLEPAHSLLAAWYRAEMTGAAHVFDEVNTT
ncbi:MAG: hypothetical protein JO296_13725 [Pseudonocardiales bacterium]|nr:hypothetical protein [Pseudonocardiales bacterium]MBV9651179.1 hypothetical protein [Pseudonocardiales bacterium]